MDDDNISIGSDFSLGSSIDMLSNVKQNEEKNDSTSTSSRPVSKKKKKKKRKEDAEKSKQINDKYFKWKASDGKHGESRHLPSHELHLRRQRLARMYKLKPELLRQLRNDVKKELLGDTTAISLDYMRRNMAASMMISYIKRQRQNKTVKAFMQWKFSKLCIHCLRKERIIAKLQAQVKKQEVSSKGYFIKKLFNRMANKYISKGWYTWKRKLLDAQTREKKARRAFRFWKKRFMVAGFKGWIRAVEESKRRKKLVYRTLSRTCNKLLYSGWRGWKRYLVIITEEEEEEKRVKEMAIREIERRRSQMRRILRKLESSIYHAALRSWTLYVRQHKRHENMLRRASQMWVKRAQTAAFKSWNVNVK